MHQCKNMHWAGVMESKVKDQPQGRQIFGRRCVGGTFVSKSYFGIWNADSELESKKNLFPWTSSDKYFSEELEFLLLL